MCGVSHGDRVEGRENWAVLCGGGLSGFFLSVVNYKFIEMVQINDQANLFQCYFLKKIGSFNGIFLKTKSFSGMNLNFPKIGMHMVE